MNEKESNPIRKNQLRSRVTLTIFVIIGGFSVIKINKDAESKRATATPTPTPSLSYADRRWAEEEAKMRKRDEERRAKIQASALKRWGTASTKAEPSKVAQAIPAAQAIEKGSGKWYQGGNLHNVSPSEWKRGTYENRLATAGDFVSGFYNDGKLKLPINNMDDIKAYSIQLEAAISKALDMSPEMIEKLSGQTISTDVALPLILSMGWLN